MAEGQRPEVLPVMAGSESTSTGVWVFDALRAAGITQPIYPEGVPEDRATGRLLIYQVVPGPDKRTANGTRWASQETVRVWVQDAVGSFYALKDDAAKIDQALNGRRNVGGLLDGRTVMSSDRTSEYRNMIVYKGVEYRQLGGEYRVLIT